MRKMHSHETHKINRAAVNTAGARVHERCCAWPGCDQAGDFRAPKARDRLDDYHWFCLDHVREYNARWNYFEGMSDTEFDAMVRSTATWDRPTWPLGQHGHRDHNGGERPSVDASVFWAAWEAAAGFNGQPDPGIKKPSSPTERLQAHRLKPQDREALTVLNLDETATLQDVKKRFKQLVKRYHPDANTGTEHHNDGAQARLRAIIQAYSHLVDSGALMDPV